MTNRYAAIRHVRYTRRSRERHERHVNADVASSRRGLAEAGDMLLGLDPRPAPLL